MKKTLLLALFAFGSTAIYAQDHYSGINTSKRVGILNSTINPAELYNLKNDYEVNVFNFSLNVANNKITFKDIVNGDNTEDLIFSGDKAVNMRLDAEILGPAFAFKLDKWAFAISSSAKIKADIIDVNSQLGNALINGDDIPAFGTLINTNYNQRVAAISWGEIGFSGARHLFENENNRFTGGVTFKLLFPGSYLNMAASGFRGTITPENRLENANAQLNIAYSGSLAEGFTEAEHFTKAFAGGLNGFATDLGINYQWKDTEGSGYKLNAGIAVRNLGSMKFKDNNNVSQNYRLEITGAQSLDLTQFEDVETPQEIEEILVNSGYVEIQDTKTNFKTKLPAMFSAYVDFKVHNNWHITAYTQQKLNEDNNNDQISAQNIVTFTPRYSANFFEAYVPLSYNEISDFTAGIGLRLGGFFIGSGSLLSAMVSDTYQADAYFGFRFGF